MDEHAPVPYDVLQWFESGTLIHCWKGRHRTGAAVALYRKVVCGWDGDTIWQELQRYGFGDIEKHPDILRGVLS
jgi:protein tyrosine/serine phosphatase